MTVKQIEHTLDSEPLFTKPNYTDIQKFYNNCNIFITGGTGFLGKILIHKLLSSCPEIDTIYLLVRSKRGKDVHSRVEEIFDDAMFNSVKEMCPKFRHQIQGVTGDCMLPGLGLNSFDKETLLTKVNIVFHMAATVRFDEKLKIAMQINVRACKDMLDLCSEMKNLKSLIHVSTAYTHCPMSTIDEKFYKPPIDSNKMLTLTDNTSDKLLECITPILLDKWPNTYTFTKAIAEDVIKQNSRDLPIGMFRPGIVIATYQEPVAGWIDNFYGPTGVIVGAGTGVLRTLRADPTKIANMVPVDLCVNGIIAAAWNVSERRNTKILPDPEIPVYNFCIHPSNSITWGDFTNVTSKYGHAYPTMQAIWYLCYSNNPNKLLHYLSIIFLHIVPAIFFDLIAIIIGKKPRLLNTYKKIHKFMDVIEYFAMRQWEFKMDNLHGLWDKLGDKDRKIFFFDMRQINWDFFLERYYCGVRHYLLNDPIETVPDALVRWNRLYWLHQGVKTILLLLAAKFIYSVWGFFT